MIGISIMITSNSEITTGIDWLSTTVESVVYPSDWDRRRKILPHGMMKYDCVIEYIDGRLEMTSTIRDNMKTHIVFNGSTLTQMETMYGYNSFNTLRKMGYGRPSRLDIYVDIKHGSLPIGDLRRMFNDDKSVSNARKGYYVSGAGDEEGETLYIGGRKAEKRVRIYDKQQEAKTDYEWTRVEAQFRHGAAIAVQDSLMRPCSMATSIPAIINGFIDFPGSIEWATVMGTGKIKISSRQLYESNRHLWLMDTAAKALAKEAKEGGTDIFDKFTARARGLYNDMMKEYS